MNRPRSNTPAWALLSAFALLLAAGVMPAMAQPDNGQGGPPDGLGPSNDMNETDGNETDGNETAGNETAGNETAELGGNETAGNETAGNETAGNETVELESEDGAELASDPVTVCHIPPGNPAAAHEIVVNATALPAHLGHGDVEGACPEDTASLQSEHANRGAKRALVACLNANAAWDKVADKLRAAQDRLQAKIDSGEHNENATAGMAGAITNLQAVIDRLESKQAECEEEVTELSQGDDALQGLVEEKTRGRSAEHKPASAGLSSGDDHPGQGRGRGQGGPPGGPELSDDDGDDGSNETAGFENETED